MFEIYKKTILGKKFLIIGMYIITLLFILMYISLFPSMQKQSAEFGKLFESYPKGMLEAFGIKGEISFAQLENYITIELFSFLWPILAVVLAVVFGMGAIAGEVENGTMEILLSLPISRTKILISKILAGISVLTIYSFISVFGIIFFAILIGIDYKLANYFYLFFGCLLFVNTIFAIAIFLSALLSDRGKGAALTSGIILLMYVLNVLSSLKDNLKNLKYFSFFHYFDAGEILSTKHIMPESIFIFGSIFSICLIAAIWVFNKRDVSV